MTDRALGRLELFKYWLDKQRTMRDIPTDYPWVQGYRTALEQVAIQVQAIEKFVPEGNKNETRRQQNT